MSPARTLKGPALSNQFPYYPWYPSDFRSSTSHYSLTEKAVYRELLDWSWLNGPLPEDDRRLAQICGCTLRSFRAAWREVGTKFETNGSGLINRRLEDIRKKTKEISNKRSDAGRRGGLANAQASAGANAKQTDKQNASSHTQTGDTSTTPTESAGKPPNAQQLRVQRVLDVVPEMPPGIAAKILKEWSSFGDDALIVALEQLVEKYPHEGYKYIMQTAATARRNGGKVKRIGASEQKPGASDENRRQIRALD